MPKDNFIGIFALFFEALFKGRHNISAYAIMSCVLWSSIIILIYSRISESRFFRKVSGGKGILLGYILCMIQIFFPADIRLQKHIFFKSVMNPIGKLMIYKLSLPMGEITVSKLLLIIWGIGIIVQTVRYLYGRIRMNSLVRHLPMTLMNVPETVRKIVPKKVKVYSCIGLSVPISVGIIDRMILLPDKEYKNEDICNIIRHEAVHLRMYDHITVALANILCIIYWWNPCVYILRRNMEKALEIRCDREALRGMDNTQATEYMSTLIKVFKNRYSGENYAGLGMLGSGRSMRNELESRFNAMETMLSGKKTKGANFILTIILLGIMLLSYRYVLTPMFLPEPYVEYDTIDVNGYKIDDYSTNIEGIGPYVAVNDDSYIIDYGDGRYVVINCFGEQEISEEWFNTLKDSGVRIEKAK